MFKITLKAARINAGFSIEEVAKIMKKNKGTIISWEKGATSMKITDFDDLCSLYKAPKENIVLPNALQKVE